MRVLLLTPSTFGYEKRTREAIQRIGHDVTWMDERIGNDVFSKAATRLGLLRFMPGLVQRHIDRIIERAKEFGAERLLAVNPETLEGDGFAQIKAAIPTIDIVIYRWDSMRQKPVDEKTMALASAVYSFDPDDCAADNRLRHLPLFHCFAAPPDRQTGAQAKYDYGFVGTAQMRRVRVLGRLCQALNHAGRPYFFYLTAQSPVHLAVFAIAARIFGYTGQLTRTRLPYESFLEVLAASRAAVDIEFKRQTGLTMRTFEVVFSGMPLLTTNPSIKLYDFSCEAPVFVFDEENTQLPDVAGFTGKGAGAYFQQYSIDSWARTLMDKQEPSYFRPGDDQSNACPQANVGQTATSLERQK